MSDAGQDPTLSDNEANGHATAAENADGGSPLNTVEGNGLEDDEDDLFGDGGDDADGNGEDAQAEQRKLDDAELDSGDDEGRADRVRQPEPVEEVEQQTFAYMDADLARHSVPEPTDNELYLLKVPRFLSFEDKAFDHKTFQPPTTDHHSKVAASEHFSAFHTAMTTVRWRRSPSNNAVLQSNARVLRWSDGSLTLQLASDPTVQFDIDANTLAPPQINPKIPTPTAVKEDKTGAKTSAKKESYTYLVAPYEEANVMRVTNKLTASLNVVPAANTKDAALEKLQNDLAKVAAKGRDDADQAISFINVDEDPELRRQREEATFKEKQRQLRAREKHEARQAERANRTMGRTGGRASGGGLDIDGLEDRAPRRQQQKKSGLRRDMSDDEDYGGPRRNREDDYDEDDDFIAGSDEEPEIVDDDDDPDEGIALSPKRARGGATAADDDDDDEVVVSRTKRRRVVDDDEDEE
ncbi:leo1-like protein [Stemphylium lycopersici]|uniref:Leo1-like protein n=1 Tax=Stemphylium lycopersici TaxID=183478 RepID=A0A364N009_STELY|nr:leo1-like protein [Stemphylium lycopersici]